MSDRHSRMPNSSMHAPPKKDGGGGAYTWGRPEDCGDFEPLGTMAQPKVTTSASSTQRHVEAPPQEVPRRTSDIFPKLPSVGESTASSSGSRAALMLTAAQQRALKVAAVTGATTSVCLGTCGATAGALCGGAAGLIVGAVPAIFTFGLSIPVGCCVGAGLGLASGAAVGASSGLVAGTAAGGAIYSRRAYFRRMWRKFKATPTGEQLVSHCRTVSSHIVALRKKTEKKITVARIHVTNHVHTLRSKSTRWWALAKDQASDAKEALKQASEDPAYQVAAASGCGGAALLGATGGGVGFLAGGVAGAAAGVIPAIFTFGLSIPVGAALGSGCGLVAGSTVGGAIGFVGGSTGGYTAYTRRGQIKEILCDTNQKLATCIKQIRGA
mmetsp:Transcript_59026/g.140967  ORF Transcript_59026/g.140967 Transcript_59026/m.140967 type:complete len:383 (-) Transcript_59026:146-1294(-)